jgi:hypothetical protein
MSVDWPRAFAGVLHAAHHRWGAAAGSLAMRLLVPATGVAIGAAACNEGRGGQGDSEFGCVGELVAGAIVGFLIVYIVDWGVLPWESQPTWLIRVGDVSANPRVSASPSGELTFGLGGVF